MDFFRETRAGEQLPTVRGLAQEAGINSMTVKKAYQQLKAEGYIVTDRRNGAMVNENLQIGTAIPEVFICWSLRRK